MNLTLEDDVDEPHGWSDIRLKCDVRWPVIICQTTEIAQDEIVASENDLAAWYVVVVLYGTAIILSRFKIIILVRI